MVHACLVFGLSVAILGPADSHWHQSYADALAEAKLRNRALFIVFDAGSSSTGNMARQGPFLSEDVEQLLVTGFVRLFVDIETEAGQKIVRTFGSPTVPRTVIIDRSGKWQVYRRVGIPTSAELPLVLKSQRSADGKFIRSTYRTTSSLPQSRIVFPQPRYSVGPNCPT